MTFILLLDLHTCFLVSDSKSAEIKASTKSSSNYHFKKEASMGSFYIFPFHKFALRPKNNIFIFCSFSMLTSSEHMLCFTALCHRSRHYSNFNHNNIYSYNVVIVYPKFQITYQNQHLISTLLKTALCVLSDSYLSNLHIMLLSLRFKLSTICPYHNKTLLPKFPCCGIPHFL